MPYDNDFGFTNDAARIERVRQFRDAAGADGWSIKPTYGNESVDRASTLSRDGFIMMVLTREKNIGPKWNYETSIHIWGPDGLAITTPDTYDFGAISAAVTKCNYCGAEGPTSRVGFAGRACGTCAPIEQRKLGPRWAD